MLHHNQEQSAGSLQTHPDPKTVQVDRRVEAYLDRVCASLSSAATPDAIIEARAEMRTHIDSLIEAYVELNEPMEIAADHALEQFGKQSTLRREWQLAAPPAKSMRGPLKVGLSCSIGAYLIAQTAVPIAMQYTQDRGMAATVAVTNFQLFVLPVAAGMLTGLLATHRPVRAALFSILLLTLPIGIIDAIQSSSMGPTMWQVGLISGVLTALICWLPLACAGAAVTGAFKKLMSWRRNAIAQ